MTKKDSISKGQSRMDRENIGQAKNRETKEVRTINDNLTREASVARAKMDRLRRVDRTRINVCEIGK